MKKKIKLISIILFIVMLLATFGGKVQASDVSAGETSGRRLIDLYVERNLWKK